MELKICPDGQNKGFGQKNGKQRARETHRKKGRKVWWWRERKRRQVK